MAAVQGRGDHSIAGIKPSLVRLVLISAVSGALTGIVGAAFRLAEIEADGLRVMVIAWARHWPAFGWLVPVALAAILVATVP